jgi:hypothetical protein
MKEKLWKWYEHELGTLVQIRNHEIALLGIDAYYSGNTFEVTIKKLWSVTNVATTLVDGPPLAQDHRIRSLAVRIPDCSFGSSPEVLFFQNGALWQYLLHPRGLFNDGEIMMQHESARNWQSRYSNVRDSTIRLELGNTASPQTVELAYSECLFFALRLETLEDWLRATDVVELKADKVRVSLAHYQKASGKGKGAPPACRCTAPIEKLIAGMIKRLN